VNRSAALQYGPMPVQARADRWISRAAGTTVVGLAESPVRLATATCASSPPPMIPPRRPPPLDMLVLPRHDRAEAKRDAP